MVIFFGDNKTVKLDTGLVHLIDILIISYLQINATRIKVQEITVTVISLVFLPQVSDFCLCLKSCSSFLEFIFKIMDNPEFKESYKNDLFVQNGETDDALSEEKNGTYESIPDLQAENMTLVNKFNTSFCPCGDECVPANSTCITDETSTTKSMNAADCNGYASCEMLQRTSKNPWSIVTLPPELILVIFSYLDARFTLRVLTCVCRLFYNLLSPESSWKTRFGKQWPRRDNREDYDYISRFATPHFLH